MRDDLRKMTNRHRSRPAAPLGARRQGKSFASGAQARSSEGARATYERYLALARSKALAGDYTEAENYYQYAEHYLRAMGENAL